MILKNVKNWFYQKSKNYNENGLVVVVVVCTWCKLDLRASNRVQEITFVSRFRIRAGPQQMALLQKHCNVSPFLVARKNSFLNCFKNVSILRHVCEKLIWQGLLSAEFWSHVITAFEGYSVKRENTLLLHPYFLMQSANRASSSQKTQGILWTFL